MPFIEWSHVLANVTIRYVRLMAWAVCRLSRFAPTQVVEIFDNIFAPREFGD